MSVREGESEEVLVAEVVGDSASCAGGPERVPKLALGEAEEPFEIVGRGWNPRIVEASEDACSVSFGNACDVVDEGAGRSPESDARSCLLQLDQEIVEAGPRVLGGLGPVFAGRIRRDLVRDGAQDVKVARDPPSRSGLMPVRLQRLLKRLENWVPPPFFKASSTVFRMASMRWFRTCSGGLRGALPVARAA